eukprot:3909383-Pyramimonas_sp.AAC.1
MRKIPLILILIIRIPQSELASVGVLADAHAQVRFVADFGGRPRCPGARLPGCPGARMPGGSRVPGWPSALGCPEVHGGAR